MNTEQQAARESETISNHFEADELFVRIEHEATTALRIDNEPGDFIRRFKATIFRSSPDSELDEMATKVATISFQVLATAAWGERPSLMEVFDAESADRRTWSASRRAQSRRPWRPHLRRDGRCRTA